MTKLLERAVKRVQTLSDSEQNAIATMILEEIEDEAQWEKSFAHTQGLLARLADEAMADDHAGRTEVLDPDRL